MKIFKFIISICFLFLPCVELNAQPGLLLALYQRMKMIRDKGKYYDALPYFEGKTSKYRIYERLSNDLEGVSSEKLAIEDSVYLYLEDDMIIFRMKNDDNKMFFLEDIMQPSQNVKIKDLGNTSELEVTLRKGSDIAIEDISYFGIIHKKEDPDNKFYLYEFMDMFGNLEAISAYVFYLDEKDLVSLRKLREETEIKKYDDLVSEEAANSTPVFGSEFVNSQKSTIEKAKEKTAKRYNSQNNETSVDSNVDEWLDKLREELLLESTNETYNNSKEGTDSNNENLQQNSISFEFPVYAKAKTDKDSKLLQNTLQVVDPGKGCYLEIICKFNDSEISPISFYLNKSKINYETFDIEEIETELLGECTTLLDGVVMIFDGGISIILGKYQVVFYEDGNIRIYPINNGSIANVEIKMFKTIKENIEFYNEGYKKLKRYITNHFKIENL